MRVLLLVICITGLGLAACGGETAVLSEPTHPPANNPAATPSTQAEPVEAATESVMPPPAASAEANGAEALPEAAELVALTQQDMAAVLGVAIEEIAVTAVEPMVWPDAMLGCGAARGMVEPQPTPGYIIHLQYGDQAFTYHADESGRFLRCLLPEGKPIDPIR